jgi:hypothetical protein
MKIGKKSSPKGKRQPELLFWSEPNYNTPLHPFFLIMTVGFSSGSFILTTISRDEKFGSWWSDDEVCGHGLHPR